MDAGGRLLTHRVEQFCANPAKTRIAKAPEIILQHRSGPLFHVRCYRITVHTSGESIRACANPVAPLPMTGRSGVSSAPKTLLNRPNVQWQEKESHGKECPSGQRPTAGGRVHDKWIADATPYPLPAGSRLLHALGVRAREQHPYGRVDRPTNQGLVDIIWRHYPSDYIHQVLLRSRCLKWRS
jgi:hypothetical protein